MEKCYEYNQELFMLFVDYKQAYNSIIRESLWKVMEKLVVPVKITRMIRACVQNSKCMVKFNSQLSKAFMINKGLKQGDTFSLMLFYIVLEEVVTNALNTGIGVKLQESERTILSQEKKNSRCPNKIQTGSISNQIDIRNDNQ